MSDLEELELKKKELLLRQEIAELERKERIRSAANRFAEWSWGWVAPLTLVGIYFLLLGVGDGKPPALVIAVLMLIPVGLKLFHGAGKKAP